MPFGLSDSEINNDETKQATVAGYMEQIGMVTMKVALRAIENDKGDVAHTDVALCAHHQVCANFFGTKNFDTESGECALKQLAAQGVGHPVLAWVMYMVVASMHVGLLPPPLGNFFNSEETHVVLLNVIASLLLKLAKDNLIKLYDLADPAAEDAARKVVDDKLRAYSSRPAVVEAGVTEDWIQSFFLKQRPADAAPDDDGNESD